MQCENQFCCLAAAVDWLKSVGKGDALEPRANYLLPFAGKMANFEDHDVYNLISYCHAETDLPPAFLA